MAAADGGAPRQKLRSDRLLLVEGRDEVNLFDSLLKHCLGDTADRDIQIIEAGGKDRFRRNIQAIRADAASHPPLRVLGVIRDADDSADGAFRSVCDALRHAGYEPPAAHGEVSGDNPLVGVFILPDGIEAGAMETLCRRSVAGREASRCVDTYIECLKDREVLHSRNEDKTFAHAYLAAAKDPVARVGEGARQGAWNFDDPAFGKLSAFLRTLFVSL